MIQQVYQYIYEVEEKRVDKIVRKVEGIYDKSPVDFDPMQVEAQLEKIQKEKQNLHLYKSHQEIY